MLVVPFSFIRFFPILFDSFRSFRFASVFHCLCFSSMANPYPPLAESKFGDYSVFGTFARISCDNFLHCMLFNSAFVLDLLTKLGFGARLSFNPILHMYIYRLAGQPYPFLVSLFLNPDCALLVEFLLCFILS